MEFLTCENSIIFEISQFKNLELNTLKINQSEKIFEKIIQNDQYEDSFLQRENTNELFDVFKMKKSVQNENVFFQDSYINDILYFQGLNIRVWLSVS